MNIAAKNLRPGDVITLPTVWSTRNRKEPLYFVISVCEYYSGVSITLLTSSLRLETNTWTRDFVFRQVM